MLLNLLFSLSALASTGTSCTDCLDSYYDLGPEAAAIGISCNYESPDQSILKYCNREKLIETGDCNGKRDPIPCEWRNVENAWVCTRAGAYPLTAIIKRTAIDRISYKFESSFNSGELEGIKLSNRLF